MIRLTLPTLIFSAYLEVLIDIFGQLLHNLDKKRMVAKTQVFVFLGLSTHATSLTMVLTCLNILTSKIFLHSLQTAISY
jgi:hypothetical protein